MFFEKKVFHGADSDIEWLQKDCGIYVVNMFDTHQAARELNLPAFSLAYLLKSYCDIDANKQFQLADWRIRLIDKKNEFFVISLNILDLYPKNIFVMLEKIHIIFFIFMIYYEIF